MVLLVLHRLARLARLVRIRVFVAYRLLVSLVSEVRLAMILLLLVLLVRMVLLLLSQGRASLVKPVCAAFMPLVQHSRQGRIEKAPCMAQWLVQLWPERLDPIRRELQARAPMRAA